MTVMKRFAALIVVSVLGCGGSSAQPDGASSGDGGAACGTMNCSAAQVCVRTIMQGGACVLPEDGGLLRCGFAEEPS